MSSSDVTVEGLQGTRPDREALTGVNHIPQAERNGRRRKRRAGRRDEDSMVGEAEFSSYYGKPVSRNPPGPSGHRAATCSSAGSPARPRLAAGAQLSGRPRSRGRSSLGAAGAIGSHSSHSCTTSAAPERFLNMLRVFKPTSPMSVGSWILSRLRARCKRRGRQRAAGLARRAPARRGSAPPQRRCSGFASYTAALIADTAVPAWHEGHRELPFLFVGSAASAAAGLGLLARAPRPERAGAAHGGDRRALAEIGPVQLLERRLGIVAETYHHGRAGRLMRAAEALTAAGRRGRPSERPAAAGSRRSPGPRCWRPPRAPASASSRPAGIRARPRRYTVVPQRERSRAAQPGGEGPPSAPAGDGDR